MLLLFLVLSHLNFLESSDLSSGSLEIKGVDPDYCGDDDGVGSLESEIIRYFKGNPEMEKQENLDRLKLLIDEAEDNNNVDYSEFISNTD